MSRFETVAVGLRREGVSSLAALVFSGLLGAGLRYVPAYLTALGASPLIVGLLGSCWLLFNGSVSGTGLLARINLENRVGLDILAILGLVAWVIAPIVGNGTLTSGLPFLVGGLALIALRDAAPSGSGTAATTTGTLVREGLVRGTLATVGGLLVVGVLLRGARGTVPALTTTFALTAALGAVAVVLCILEGDIPQNDIRSTVNWQQFINDIACLSPARRSLLLADITGRFVFGMTAPFLVLTVVYEQVFDLLVIGIRLKPLPAFAGLAALDVVFAAVSVPLAIAVIRRTGPIVIGMAALVVSAAVPLVLVTAPARPLVFAALFAGYGLRHGGWIVIDALVDESFGTRSDGTYRLVRTLLIAPSALFGGLLYGLNPTAAFGIATTIGGIACWEWFSFAISTRGEA